MMEKEKLKGEIQDLRNQLQQLIEEKDTVIDSEILALSRILDEMLVEYEKLLKEEQKRQCI